MGHPLWWGMQSSHLAACHESQQTIHIPLPALLATAAQTGLHLARRRRPFSCQVLAHLCQWRQPWFQRSPPCRDPIVFAPFWYARGVCRWTLMLGSPSCRQTMEAIVPWASVARMTMARCCRPLWRSHPAVTVIHPRRTGLWQQPHHTPRHHALASRAMEVRVGRPLWWRMAISHRAARLKNQGTIQMPQPALPATAACTRPHLARRRRPCSRPVLAHLCQWLPQLQRSPKKLPMPRPDRHCPVLVQPWHPPMDTDADEPMAWTISGSDRPIVSSYPDRMA